MTQLFLLFNFSNAFKVSPISEGCIWGRADLERKVLFVDRLEHGDSKKGTLKLRYPEKWRYRLLWRI